MGRPSSPPNLPSHGGYEPPSNTWSLRPSQVLNPKGSSIGAAVGRVSFFDVDNDEVGEVGVVDGHSTDAVEDRHERRLSTAAEDDDEGS